MVRESPTAFEVTECIREGQVVYEQNAENVRDAQESLSDALFDLDVAKLEDQIESLNDELEKINEAYEEQVKLLDAQVEKWEKIKSDAEAAKNAALGDQYLGSGFGDKVISGNDDEIYNAFKNNYEANSKLITQYEKQISTTENIYNLLNSYITSYRDGTLSYEQALAGVQKILSQMNSDMSAGQNIQNIVDYLAMSNNTEANANAVLNGIQESLDNSSKQMLDSLEQYNENLSLIADCTTSWEQLTNNVADIRDLMDEVLDALEEGFENAARHDREEEEEWDEESGDHSSGTITAGGYDPSDYGPGTEDQKNDPSFGYAKGIAKGVVGKKTKGEIAENLQRLSLHEYAFGETPELLHAGEVVLNPMQQQTLWDNISNVSYPVINTPTIVTPDFSENTKPTSISFTMGNVTLPDVRDVDGFAKAIKSSFQLIMSQELGKGKWR